MTNCPRSVKIPTKIREIRTKRGLSQTDLARKTGITSQAIAQYETGRTNLSLLTLCRMADALQCTTDEILGR